MVVPELHQVQFRLDLRDFRGPQASKDWADHGVQERW